MENILDNILIAEQGEYELLDSGEGEKLERFGSVTLRRPDPQSLWPKTLSPQEWQKADAVFTPGKTAGRWKMNIAMPADWKVAVDGITFILKLMPSKHVGLFPEQAPMWKWIAEAVSKAGTPSVLNLFGYTGGASLSALRAGGDVVHVDSSESALEWAKKNRDASGLSSAPIRYIADDARKFVEREIRRGKTYDLIVLDPPVYGKGSKKEIWNIDTDLPALLFRLEKLLSKNPLGVVLNGYASGYSHLTYARLLESAFGHRGGKISSGEYAIRDREGRLLPAGIWAKWEK